MNVLIVAGSGRSSAPGVNPRHILLDSGHTFSILSDDYQKLAAGG